MLRFNSKIWLLNRIKIGLNGLGKKCGYQNKNNVSSAVCELDSAVLGNGWGIRFGRNKFKPCEQLNIAS